MPQTGLWEIWYSLLQVHQLAPPSADTEILRPGGKRLHLNLCWLLCGDVGGMDRHYFPGLEHAQENGPKTGNHRQFSPIMVLSGSA